MPNPLRHASNTSTHFTMDIFPCIGALVYYLLPIVLRQLAYILLLAFFYFMPNFNEPIRLRSHAHHHLNYGSLLHSVPHFLALLSRSHHRYDLKSIGLRSIYLKFDYLKNHSKVRYLLL